MKSIITPVLAMLLILSGCESKKAQEIHLQEVFPPVPINHAALFRINNLPITPAYFKDQWTLLVLDDSDCQDPCLQRLNQINRIKGVQKLLFADDLANQGRLRELFGLYPEIAITSGTTMSSVESFMRQFKLEDIDPAQVYQHVYVVSPQAELVYVVPADDIAAGMLGTQMPLLLAK